MNRHVDYLFYCRDEKHDYLIEGDDDLDDLDDDDVYDKVATFPIGDDDDSDDTFAMSDDDFDEDDEDESEEEEEKAGRTYSICRQKCVLSSLVFSKFVSVNSIYLCNVFSAGQMNKMDVSLNEPKLRTYSSVPDESEDLQRSKAVKSQLGLLGVVICQTALGTLYSLFSLQIGTQYHL